MLITGLDDREYVWSVSKYKKKKRKVSKHHLRARELLSELFPFETILEELTLPGSKTAIRKTVLYADFYIHSYRLMVEVHGKQHYSFTSHFHKDKKSFFQSKMRDRDKRKWCDKNSIVLVELPYNETTNEWEIRMGGENDSD